MVSSVPFGPINNIQQTFNHPQAVARGVVVEVEVKITVRSSFRHFLSFALASARWKDQAGSSGGHLQWEKDASEQTPAMAFSAYR
jgi:crotonobetainyl-CoA:carnitine CoA-transferase CaiB-like acyl-CoA transferase